MPRIDHFVCTQCGCVCDDLSIVTEGPRITSSSRACRIAEAWFESRSHPESPSFIDHAPVPFEEALARAVELLSAARSPLIFGLSHSSTEAQRYAVALAETLRGTIDTTASTGHAPSIVALQQVGESTCTLGEVRQRADLVIYWGCDPDLTHPRHRERYSPDRPGRSIVVVDDEANATRLHGTLDVRVDAGQHLSALTTLRLLTAGHSVPASRELTALAGLVRGCRFGIVFFGRGITAEPVANRVVEELLKWVSELNRERRFYARRLRRSGDVAGADSVLAWQTGYPFAVNFATGYPRSNPGEFSGPEMLARGEVDVCLLVGRSTDLPAAAVAAAERIPLIAIESAGERHARPPAVRLITADYGLHRAGTAYRMDEVAIPLRAVLASDLPSDADVLEEIHRRITARLAFPSRSPG